MSAPQVDDSADILTRRCIVQLTRGCKYAHCTNPFSARCPTFQKPPDSQLRQKISEMVSGIFLFSFFYTLYSALSTEAPSIVTLPSFTLGSSIVFHRESYSFYFYSTLFSDIFLAIFLQNYLDFARMENQTDKAKEVVLTMFKTPNQLSNSFRSKVSIFFPPSTLFLFRPSSQIFVYFQKKPMYHIHYLVSSSIHF